MKKARFKLKAGLKKSEAKGTENIGEILALAEESLKNNLFNDR